MDLNPSRSDLVETMQFFIIDAFTKTPFKGNPAAVCILEQRMDDDWMQAVAAEMGVSETAFVVQGDNDFHLRWFTPQVEVDLCGHATLATSHALWSSGLCNESEEIRFQTKSGTLTAKQDEGVIFLDFPAKVATESEMPEGLAAAMGIMPVFCGKNQFDILMQVGSQADVENVKVDFERLGQIPVRGVILTAASDNDQYDFVSRFFAPAVGINEDPVTGSAHVCLAPFWSDKLGKSEMVGYQASPRGGVVTTRLQDDRVHLGGTAVVIVKGELIL